MKNPQIVSDPQILGGKPIIAGTRISVEIILDKIAAGMSEKDILIDYPHLNAHQIQAVVSYAKKVVTAKHTKGKQESLVTLYTHEISR